jgi:hypothetical protein
LELEFFSVYRSCHFLLVSQSLVNPWFYPLIARRNICLALTASYLSQHMLHFLWGWLIARMRPSKGPSGTKPCKRPMIGFPARMFFLHHGVHRASAVRDKAVRLARASLASQDITVLRGKSGGTREMAPSRGFGSCG